MPYGFLNLSHTNDQLNSGSVNNGPTQKQQAFLYMQVYYSIVIRESTVVQCYIKCNSAVPGTVVQVI